MASGRIYTSFSQARNELQRDLKEMGKEIRTKSVQGMDLASTHDYDTVELENVLYTITAPDLNDLSLPNPTWAMAEWQERLNGINGIVENPGSAFVLRNEANGDLITWADHLDDNGKFHYNYAERFDWANQVNEVVNTLKNDLNSRQGIISVWNPAIDATRTGARGRVPCSITYHLMHRDGKMNITYYMRSCEFATHYQNDLFMAYKLLEYVANEVGVPIGRLTHFVNSFHCYQRNLRNVF